jgi:cell wall-associated NlpC family hydrolase
MHLSFAGRRRVPAAAAVLGLCTALLPVLAVAPAAANPPGPHDPFGKVRRVTAVPGGVKFTGWALDPDELTTNIEVGVLVDGLTWSTFTPTSIPNATVTTTYAAGPTPGFSITSPIDTRPHTVCLVARNVDAGLDTVLDCVPTPLGTTLTSTQLAARSPQGAIEKSGARAQSVRVAGWATDPDFIRRKATVVLYLDGSPAATVNTSAYAGTRPAGAGPRSAFDIRVPASTGMHVACIWLVNIGLGSNTFLGCRAADTRGRAGTGPVEVPKLNTEVVTEAKRHIGQAYVWGAEGPRTFDCSGLVMYSYGKFGFVTPRVSQDQAHAARLIPASRAVPGDLVFWHDNEGDVYHVGIYLSPGRTVAAIDEAEGVDYQKIWDTSIVTYGSFTHT